MTEKFYLGISLGFNSSACIVSNKRGLIAAISQERLNGKKNTKELPFDAIAKCIEITGVKVIEQIAISHYEVITNEYFQKYQATEGPYTLGYVTNWQECILNILRRMGVGIINYGIVRVDHHTAHALSTLAFYDNNFKAAYTITSDGFGDGLSGKIVSSLDSVLSEIPVKNSIGLVYQFVTGALGFKEHQHEGKITGLAAFGKPIYVKNFEDLYNLVDYGNGLDFKDDEYDLDAYETELFANSSIIGFDMFLKLKKAVYGLVNDLTSKGACREDIAASVQEFAEKYTLIWIERYCKDKHLPCYIAGGLFANVKINQRIKETNIFSHVFVCPAMGDEGTCVGAALYLIRGEIDTMTIPQSCGTAVGTDSDRTIAEVTQYLEQNDLSHMYSVFKAENVIDSIAARLATDKIVCLMRDSMEFGPRALCHRSILYNCDTKETNDWLNKKLSRTEFMPFAPVCRREVANDLFVDLYGGRFSAKFMTMTFDCTPEFARNYPAACHIDNTARPQVVDKDDDPFMWEVLNKYQDLTGKKALINTSFNLHNWPIIETEKVGLESWITSDTDCLVIGDVIIEKKEDDFSRHKSFLKDKFMEVI